MFDGLHRLLQTWTTERLYVPETKQSDTRTFCYMGRCKNETMVIAVVTVFDTTGTFECALGYLSPNDKEPKEFGDPFTDFGKLAEALSQLADGTLA